MPLRSLSDFRSQFHELEALRTPRRVFSESSFPPDLWPAKRLESLQYSDMRMREHVIHLARSRQFD